MKEFEGRTVLVTGGLGFIGSNTARKLVELGAEVTLLDSMDPHYGANLHNVRDIKDDVHVNYSDMRDIYSLNYLVKDVDYIFNFAGQVSHLDSMNDPFTDLDINVKAQLSLLEACRENNLKVKIVYASTRQIYGKPLYMPVDEGHLLQPTDVNGINKMAGEWYHILYSRVYGIRSCALRLTNCYGPGQLIKHSRQGFIGWFIKQIVDGEEIQIYGDGSQMRDFNYITDVVDGFLKAALSNKSDGNVYNLGAEDSISLKDVVKLMIEINGKGSYKLIPWPEERKKIDIGDYHSNFEKIKSDLSWSPSVPLKEGLTSTINYYNENLEHYL